MSWTTIVIIICLLIAAFALWLEFKRENRLRLLWRVLAVFIVVAALACIILPVSYHTQTMAASTEGVLLTDGFNPDSLAKYPGTKLFSTESIVIKSYPKLKISLVNDLGDFAIGRYAVTGLQVLGYGLSEEELAALQQFPIKFHGAKLPSGITAISWDKHIKVGEKLTVQGKIANTSGKKISLVLKGLNTGLDSMTVSATGSSDFALGFTPKNTGRAAYKIVALAGKDTLDSESIPIEIEPSKPLKVLMLASSPDFENRFLRDWLSHNGYGLAVRTAITKGKFSRDYFNMAQIPVDNITTGLLEKFDLVVGDLSSFKELTPAESGSLKEQMLTKGLGVIVKADSSKGTSFLPASFPTERFQVKDQHAMTLMIGGKASSAKLPLDAVNINYLNNTQPLVSDEQNHILASSTIYGAGKIVYTILGNTFNWALAGNSEDYSALWSLLIGKAARKIPATEKWNVSPEFPMANMPNNLMLEGPTVAPAKIYATTSLLAFKQNADVPFKWEATFWPITAGWQTVYKGSVASFWWYVYPNNAWNVLVAHKKIAAMQDYFAKAAKSSPEKNLSTQNSIEIPVSKLYFYIVLLLCGIYLWVERKL